LYTPVIPVLKEAEARELRIPDQPGLSMRLCLKKKEYKYITNFNMKN
jgi:hypothetical protein